jgi:3-hydroxyisobutyrate dehydrogenase-like beta-hydroxyacid dehydrogenase
VLSRRFDAGFSLALMVKDLATALELAHDFGTPAPLCRVRALWTRAAAARRRRRSHRDRPLAQSIAA